jgi:hypothetical protein
MRPVFPPGLERFFDQDAAKARAVDEEVALHHRARLQAQGLHMPIFGPGVHLLHDAFHPLDTQAFAIGAQIACVQAGIKVKGIGHLRQGRVGQVGARAHELVLQTGRGVDRIGLQRLGLAGQVLLEPVLVKVHRPVVLANHAKAVDVAVAQAPPIHELNTELEAGLGLPHELVFVDFEHAVEQRDHRNRGLAHANGADVVRLHEGDVVLPAQHLGQCGSRHPTRGAAAQHHDLLKGLRHVRDCKKSPGPTGAGAGLE